MRHDLSHAMILALGFVTGVSATAYLILADPEVRMMFDGKKERMRGAGWKGLVNEIVRGIVVELKSENLIVKGIDVLRGDT